MSRTVTCRVTGPGSGAWFDAVACGETTSGLRVAGVAPGDLLEVRPRPDDPPWGDPLRVLAPGPGRREPCCRLAGACGGCHWLQLDENVQQGWRVRQLRACLARAGVGLGSAPLRAVAAPRALGYRYRARFQVDASRHPWRIGYHGAGSTRVVDAPGCPLLAPELDSVYRALRTWLPAGGPSGLSGLEIVTLPGHERGLVLLNPRDRAPSGWPACGERLLGALPDRVAGVSVRLPGRDARPELLGAPWLAGRTPAGHPVVAPAGGFLQANLAAADALGDVVVKAARADREPRCLELHAGSGLLSFRLAAGGARVTAIELDPRAVRAAEALPAPPRGQLSFACDDALGGRTPGRLRSVDVVVADPPRSGLGGLAAVLALSGPPRVVLVSCSTRTLAGDLARLTAGGYRLAELTVVDLFPQTRHLETVAVLVR